MADDPRNNPGEETDPQSPVDEPVAQAPGATGGDDQAEGGAAGAAPEDRQSADEALASVEAALAETEQAVEGLGGGEADAGAEQTAHDSVEGRNVELPNFQQVLADVEASGLELLHDVELNVKIELGRTDMLVEDVLRLAEGSVVELDKLAGDPVDIYVNERLVARGEVLVLNENFCVRISEIVGETDPADQDEDEVRDASGAAAE
jgi:flagellar motor switch protein FliN/FliY